MRQAATGALLIVALVTTVSGVWLPVAVSALPAVHGIGAAALPDNPRILTHNPALLADHEVLRLSTSLQAQSQWLALQGDWLLPTLTGPNWGFGLQHQRSESDTSRWRQQAQVGLGQALSQRWSIGSGLDLWNDDESRDYAAHVGLVFAAPATSSTQVHLAVVGRNLIEATSGLAGPGGKRHLDVAAALHHNIASVWMLTSSAGFRCGRDLRRSASVAAVLRWKERLEGGVGWQENVPRLAAGWRNQAWSVGWSLALEGNVHTHDVGVSWSWGASLSQRRAEQQRLRAEAINQHAEGAVSDFQTQQLAQWKRFADEAFESGDLDRAASFFGMVLTTFPEDIDAQAGFKRSRHAMFVVQADSLMKRSDYGGAARSLEAALQIAPDDSSSAVRLREVRRASRLALTQQTDAEQLFRHGIDAFAKQEYLQAIDDFRGVLALDPDHHMATSYLSQAEQSQRNHIEGTLKSASQRLRANDHEAARRLVHRLLADQPDQPSALQLLVKIDNAEKRAVARAKAAQEEEQRRAAAEKAQRAADSESSTPSVEDAAPQPPSAEVIARYEEGIRLYRTGDMMAAMQAWEEVAARASDYQDVGSYLLRVYRVAGLERYTEGRLQEAVDIWKKALLLDPQNRQLGRYLSQAQAKLKRATRSGGGN